jgi:excisionase family DNA binding protein
MNENEYLTIKEVGSLLRVSRSTMERLCANDKNLPKPYRVGIKKLWKRSDIEEYLQKSRERSDIEEGLEKTWK